MYLIHIKTQKTTVRYEGSWPSEWLEEQLNQGKQLIVTSLYSNTIKVPHKVIDRGIVEWEWDDYPLHIAICDTDAASEWDSVLKW